MSDVKVPFGPAVADVIERRTLEEQAATRTWTLAEVEWFEKVLHDEGVTNSSTFYRDRSRQVIAALKASHERGDYRLTDEMTRAEFAAHLSAGMDRPLADHEVFDRVEVRSLVSALTDAETERTYAGPQFKPGPVRDPIMGVLTTANREGRIMGQGPNAGGVVIQEIRGNVASAWLSNGMASFRGETNETRTARVQRIIDKAKAAVELRDEIKRTAEQLAELERTDAGDRRMLRSAAQFVSRELAGIRRKAAELAWFERWVLEGDEVKRLEEILDRTNRSMEQAT